MVSLTKNGSWVEVRYNGTTYCGSPAFVRTEIAAARARHSKRMARIAAENELERIMRWRER